MGEREGKEMKKKPAEMTFKEFFEKAKEQGIDNKTIEEIRHFMLDILHQEAFTDEQISEMKMEKVWRCVIDSFSMFADQFFTEVGMAAQQQKITPMQLQILKNLRKFFEHQVEELEKEEKQREKE